MKEFVFAPLALMAFACNGDAATKTSATSAASAVASANGSARPQNAFVPPMNPMAHHEATTVHVPHEGAARTQKTKAVPGGSPAPRKAVARADLPKKLNLPPWECDGKDACHFHRMPFYAQTNPNFAHVPLPKALYDADTKKLTGPIVWDDATHAYALELDPDTDKTLDPFYATWLPYGPVSDKDDGYIGYWYTAICSPSAQAMAVMAALATKSAGTKIKPGSWVEQSLVKAERPAEQPALPSPLLRDHTTLAPNQYQMTDVDIQRVVNFAVRQKTSPVAGGAGDVILQLGDDFEPVDGKSPVETRSGDRTTNRILIDAIRDRFAPTIGVYGWKASLKPVASGGKTVKYALTFANTSGHVMAVNGFTTTDGKKPHILFYDPVYANPVEKTILEVPIEGATKDGVPIEVTPPDDAKIKSLTVIHDFGDKADNDATPAITRIDDITDGMDIVLAGGFTAIKID